MRIFDKVKFLLLTLFVLIFSSCLTPYNTKEITGIKKNKTFWSWNSPHGKLDVHYVEMGSGDKHILLIHGFAAHTYTWHYIMEPLAKAGYHVWAIDLVGSGLSDKPIHITYNLELFTSQLKAFLDAKQIPHATLIGNSMGGGVALGMAIEDPQRTDALVLIDALGYPLNLPAHLAIPKTMGSVGQYFFGRWTVKWALQNVMYDHSKITEEQIDAYLFPHMLPGGDVSFIKLLTNFDNEVLKSLSRQYKNIKVPTLIIWGEQDELIPISHLQLFKRDFPNAKTLVIPECGHIPQEECPQPIIEGIIRFLNT